MNKNLVKKWLVVKIKPNSYDMAIRNLERQGFEFFGPKMKITIKKENKFIYKDILVFPGYIFVGVDRQSSTWTKINNTYGVSKVLVSNNKPCEISNDIILALKNRYEDNIKPIVKERLKNGDTIKFINGPLVDLIAKIEAIDDNSRIWVILEAMGEYKKLKIRQTKKMDIIKVSM